MREYGMSTGETFSKVFPAPLSKDFATGAACTSSRILSQVYRAPL